MADPVPSPEETLAAIAADSRKCVDFYINSPGLAGAQAIIDLYATIARLSDAVAAALAEMRD